MKLEELESKFPDLFKGKRLESRKLSELKDNKAMFNYPGVYLLTKEDEVVYIGSAYARKVRDRLLQYQQTRGSGNQTLYKDLIEAGKCSEANADTYVKSLTAHAFKDESTEYQLIKACPSAVNLAGNKEKQ